MAHDQGAEDEKENLKPSETLRMVTGKDLKTILGARAQASEDRTEINKNVRAKITEVLGDKKFLDRKMLSCIEFLYNLEDDEDVAYHLDNLLYMLDVSGIDARAKKTNPKLGLTDERKGRGGETATPLRSVN